MKKILLSLFLITAFSFSVYGVKKQTLNTLWVDGSTERVGVGTSDPDVNLHVGDSANNNSIIVNRTGISASQIELNAFSNEPQIKFTPTAGTRRGFLFKNSSDVTVMELHDAEKDIVMPSGRLGVGTDVINVSGLLHLSYSPIISDPVANKGIVLESDNVAALNLITPTNSVGYINFGNPDDSNIGRVFYNHTSDYMAFGVNAATRMTIEASGEVGIGTTTPISLLHIEQVTKNNGITFTTDDTGQTSTDGSNIFVEQISKDLIINNRENAEVAFFANGSERMTIEASGEVGIGTTNPAYLLDVAGTANIGGDLLVGGTLEFENISANTVVASGVVTANGGIDAGGNGTAIKFKVLPIGSWNMNTTTLNTTTHGLDETKIIGIDVAIFGDFDTSPHFGLYLEQINEFDISATANHGLALDIGGFDVSLFRVLGGRFDNTQFQSTSVNRGYITLRYLAD